MATINSTQSGNWSASSTWGGSTPNTGDTIIINNGHSIVYDLNSSTIFGRITINQGGSLTHKTGIHTKLCCSMFIYVYGKYEMVPDSETLFSGTSKTGGTEGQVVGIYARGDYSGCQLILNGSLPMPETTLTSNVYLGDHILPVADASMFEAGEHIAVYFDHKNETYQRWMGREQSDEGFIIHHKSGNNLYIRQLVGREDSISANISIGQNYAYVNNVDIWEIDSKLYIDNEVFIVNAIDESTNKLTFTSNATVAHSSGALMYETGCLKEYRYDINNANFASNSTYLTVFNVNQWNAGDVIRISDKIYTISSVDTGNSRIYIQGNTQAYHSYFEKIFDNSNLSHKAGNFVYKLATVSTVTSNQGTNQITVANASMLNINDRIVIEGNSRAFTAITEALITNKVGNVLTLSVNLNAQVLAGYLISKTNRDCKVSVTAESNDNSRCMIFYEYGNSSVTGRKLLLNYCELSHCGNSASSYYKGLVVRGDFNRTDTIREIKGVVVRDGWDNDRGGLFAYSFHYGLVRNNIISNQYQSINPYDSNGTSYYNNVIFGSRHSGFRYEQQYYFNQIMFNRIVNTRYYPFLCYSAYSGFHKVLSYNFSRHSDRTFYFGQNLGGFASGGIYRNYFEDYSYRNALIDITGQICIGNENVFNLGKASTGSNIYQVTWGNSEYQNTYGLFINNNCDFKKDYFEIHTGTGLFIKDKTLHLGTGWSLKGISQSATYGLKLLQYIFVKKGDVYNIQAYFRKNSAYNSSMYPFIYIKELRTNKDIYSMMENINDQWCKVELSYTANFSDMIEIAVGGRNSASNGFFWIDPRVSVTVNDILLNNLISNFLSFNMTGKNNLAEVGGVII